MLDAASGTIEASMARSVRSSPVRMPTRTTRMLLAASNLTWQSTQSMSVWCFDKALVQVVRLRVYDLVHRYCSIITVLRSYDDIK